MVDPLADFCIILSRLPALLLVWDRTDALHLSLPGSRMPLSVTAAIGKDDLLEPCFLIIPSYLFILRVAQNIHWTLLH